jgi:hypothetical protein
VTGLTPGLDYTFTVSAMSAVGVGAESAPFGPVSVSALPGAPVLTGVVGGIRSAEVTWDPPTGGEPLTRYTVVATATRPDGSTHRVGRSVLADGAEPPATSSVVTGLLPGLEYRFTVSATSAAGTGPLSAPSAPVTMASLPGVPVIDDVVAGARSATLTWSAPDSDEPLTRYNVVATATRADGSIHRVTRPATAPATSFVVTGLTVGLDYSFTISATSAVGTGAVSAPAGPVTPTFGVSVGNRSLVEGNTGQKNFSFTVSLTDAQSVPVTVDVATADLTADAGDYVGVSTTVTFEPGQRTRTVIVKVLGDTVVEPDELFVVNLSNASGGLITNAQGTGIILNDDLG